MLLLTTFLLFAFRAGETAGLNSEALGQLKHQAGQDTQESVKQNDHPDTTAAGKKTTSCTTQAAPKTNSTSKSSSKSLPESASFADVFAMGSANRIGDEEEGEDLFHAEKNDSSEDGVSRGGKNTINSKNSAQKTKVIDAVLVDDARALKQKKVDKLGIDPSEPLSKQAVQALRLLVKQGR